MSLSGRHLGTQAMSPRPAPREATETCQPGRGPGLCCRDSLRALGTGGPHRLTSSPPADGQRVPGPLIPSPGRSVPGGHSGAAWTPSTAGHLKPLMGRVRRALGTMTRETPWGSAQKPLYVFSIVLPGPRPQFRRPWTLRSGRNSVPGVPGLGQSGRCSFGVARGGQRSQTSAGGGGEQCPAGRPSPGPAGP